MSYGFPYYKWTWKTRLRSNRNEIAVLNCLSSDGLKNSDDFFTMEPRCEFWHYTSKFLMFLNLWVGKDLFYFKSSVCIWDNGKWSIITARFYGKRSHGIFLKSIKFWLKYNVFSDKSKEEIRFFWLSLAFVMIFCILKLSYYLIKRKCWNF